MIASSTKAVEVALTTARQQGWATYQGSLSSIRLRVVTDGATVVRGRTGNDFEELHSTDVSGACPNSLSGKYGLGGFPLHTDGAHISEPPDFVCLQSLENGGEADTVLVRMNSLLGKRWQLRQGIFAVAGKEGPFLASALENGRLRYDPGCMRPLDQIARQAAVAIEGLVPVATLYNWGEDHEILVIDNRRTLHGRTAAASSTRTLRRFAFRLNAPS